MKLESYATPHLRGRLGYSALKRRMPDGDTIHLVDPEYHRVPVEARVWAPHRA